MTTPGFAVPVNGEEAGSGIGETVNGFPHIYPFSSYVSRRPEILALFSHIHPTDPEPYEISGFSPRKLLLTKPDANKPPLRM